MAKPTPSVMPNSKRGQEFGLFSPLSHSRIAKGMGIACESFDFSPLLRRRFHHLDAINCPRPVARSTRRRSTHPVGKCGRASFILACEPARRSR